jgi:CRP-like cAMP-binding protein
MSLHKDLNITDTLMVKFSPLSQLSKKYLNQIIKRSQVMTFDTGETLFEKEHDLPFTYYLLEGKIKVKKNLLNSEILAAKSPRCLNPINSSIPSGVTAKALEPGYMLLVDTKFLDRSLGWTEAELKKGKEDSDSRSKTLKAPVVPSAEEYGKFDAEHFDWIANLLEFPLFFNLPPSNIDKIFEKFERLDVKEDQVIIEEGDEGDFFYLLINGSARVIIGGQEDKPIRLSKGSYFGEEALVSDTVRSASVIMNEEGVLARLDKASFQSLLHDPLVKTVNESQFKTAREANPNSTVLLDIRSEAEFVYAPIPTCLHIELAELRQKLHTLDRSKTYYLTEEGGQRSDIAAHILSQTNMSVFVIRNS